MAQSLEFGDRGLGYMMYAQQVMTYT